MNFEGFTKELSVHLLEKILFVSLGNDLRSDDAAGLLFAEKLKLSETFSNSCYINAGTNPENYLQNILDMGTDAIVFIDAANWKGSPGEIKWLDSDMIDKIAFSTHTFSIKLVEQFLSTEKVLKFYYLGIQTENTEIGTNISENVLGSINRFFYDTST
jgi:hydrogenase maturation protease